MKAGMISISRPFPGECRVSIHVGTRRLRIDYLGWIWTKSIVAISRPIGADLIFSARFLWFQVSLWNALLPSVLLRLSRLAIVERISHDLRMMATRRTQ